MKKISKTVVFFGSGPVAARSLELLQKHTPIEAVITKPRPPHHRGPVPVLELAQKLNLPTLLASNKAELSKLIAKQQFASQAGVLIDFGIIVDSDVIDAFPLGIVNSHFSVLPDLRGADPISFAILSGQPSTGVSLMLLVPAMDEGPLLSYGEQPLSGEETTPTLTEALILLSDGLLQANLPLFLDGQAVAAPQSVTGRDVSYSHKLSKSDGELDWQQPAAVLERQIRAFSGWPGSRTQLAGRAITITAAKVADSEAPTLQPGQWTVVGKQLLVGCGNNTALLVEQLKPAGRNNMNSAAFLAGHKLA